jgi:hypothetical protein
MARPISGQQFAEQQSLFEYKPSPVHTPVDFLREGAQRFVAERGGDYRVPKPDLQNKGEHGLARALAYERQPDQDPSALRSYGAFRRDLSDQWNHLTGHGPAGLGVKVEVTPDDPYPDPHAMRDDLAQNRRIKVCSSAATGGHPVLSNEENDRFRAVHDVFGHAAVGSSFTRNGEEIAYQSHAQMFSPDALPALRSETRGQNSHMIYRNAGAFGDEQRAVALPSDRALRRR